MRANLSYNSALVSGAFSVLYNQACSASGVRALGSGQLTISNATDSRINLQIFFFFFFEPLKLLQFWLACSTMVIA
jgi:hypothetical protein